MSAYTPKEDDIIREWYPKDGIKGAVTKLQLAGYSRTSESVRVRALNIGIAHAPNYDEAYEKVCDLISQGVRVADACRMADIQRSKFYLLRQEREGR